MASSRALSHIGDHLRSWRRKAGLTQAELAQRLGYASGQPVSNIERGFSHASDEVLAQWSTECKVSFAYMRKIVLTLREKQLNETHRNA